MFDVSEAAGRQLVLRMQQPTFALARVRGRMLGKQAEGALDMVSRQPTLQLENRRQASSSHTSIGATSDQTSA